MFSLQPIESLENPQASFASGESSAQSSSSSLNLLGGGGGGAGFGAAAAVVGDRLYSEEEEAALLLLEAKSNVKARPGAADAGGKTPTCCGGLNKA